MKCGQGRSKIINGYSFMILANCNASFILAVSCFIAPQKHVRGGIQLEGARSHFSATPWWIASSLLHIEAKYLPFHMGYGGLICSKRLQSDRPKWRGMPADPRRASLCKAVSKTILIWSENRGCLSFQTVTWLFVGVGQAIIPHLKEEIQGYLLILKSRPLFNW